MTMTYTSLTGSKGAAGSIMNWVSYSNLDVYPIVDEAQTLIYQNLRVREMRTEWTFSMAVGASEVALPARFLDPIGRIYDLTNGTYYPHEIDTMVRARRNFEPKNGTFINIVTQSPTTSNMFGVEIGNGYTQGSTITIAGVAAISGVDVNGTWPVTRILDANNFFFDVGALPAAAGVIGGLGAPYRGNILSASAPSCWGVWDEAVKFDSALDTAITCKLLYYRRPELLSNSNPSNWLTERYPMMMRKACQAAAADYMKDAEEFARQVKGLADLIGLAGAADDFMLRGADFGTDTP